MALPEESNGGRVDGDASLTFLGERYSRVQSSIDSAHKRTEVYLLQIVHYCITIIYS